jgi:hypothetical protein
MILMDFLQIEKQDLSLFGEQCKEGDWSSSRKNLIYD